MYGAFGRDFATTRRPARHGRRHQPQPVAARWSRPPASRSTCPPMERAFDADFTQGRGPLPRPRRHRRAAQAVVRDPHARRGAQGARRARRVLGSVPDVHAAARRRLARRRQRARCSATSTSPASARCARRRRRCGSRPSRRSPPAAAPLLGMHTDEVLADVLGLSPAEIGRLHDDGVVAERGRRRMSTEPTLATPTLADAGFAELARRPGAPRAGRAPRRVPRRRPGGARPRRAPAAVALGAASFPRCRPPALGADGHPRRRAEMDDVPPAHVGRRSGARRRGRSRIGVDAERVSRDRAGRA